MAGVGNITRIEQDYMNAMIALSRAYQRNSKFVNINKQNCFVRIGDIKSIIPVTVNGEKIYNVKTDFNCFSLTEEEFEELKKKLDI